MSLFILVHRNGVLSHSCETISEIAAQRHIGRGLVDKLNLLDACLLQSSSQSAQTGKWRTRASLAHFSTWSLSCFVVAAFDE